VATIERGSATSPTAVGLRRSLRATYISAGAPAKGRIVAAGDRSANFPVAPAWRDVAGLVTGSGHTIAVVTDGRVLAAGGSGRGECDVDRWREVVAVAA